MDYNKYNDSKIYRILSPTHIKKYIGSTTQSLNSRLSKHKTALHRGVVRKVLDSDFWGKDDLIIELIESVNCENRRELERIEGQYIKDNINDLLNKYIPARTVQEYRKECPKYKNYMRSYMKSHYVKVADRLIHEPLVIVSDVSLVSSDSVDLGDSSNADIGNVDIV